MLVKESDLKRFADGLINYFYFFNQQEKNYRNEIIVKNRKELMNTLEGELGGTKIYFEGRVLPNGLSSDEFDKKGKEFKIKIPHPNRVINPQKLIRDQIRNHGKEIYRGYGWRSRYDNTLRLVPLTMLFKGLEMLYFFVPEIYGKSENENAQKLHLYLSKVFNGAIHSDDYGENAIVYVPSTSEDVTYKVKIEHVPLRPGEWEGTKQTNHNCGYANYFTLAKKYKNAVSVWCHHGVAAFNYLKWKSQHDEYSDKKILSNIFVIPSESDMNFYNNLRNVFVHDRGYRHLTMAEKEALLWMHVLGNEKSFSYEKELSSFIIKVK